MKKISILFSLVLLASSCVKQMEEPESAKIAGMWAVVEDNDLTNKYIKFEHGVIDVYESDHVTYYVADKSIWGCRKARFNHLSSNRYSLVDGTLHYDSSHQKMRVDGETMILGDRKCRLVENFCPEYYSTINVSNPSLSFAFNGGDVEWYYSITKPVKGMVLKVSAPEWMGNIRVTDDKVRFTVSRTTASRTGTVVLSYPSAADKKITVTQKGGDINLDKTSVTLDYAASSSSFGYTIHNPQSGYTLVAKADSDWIIDLKDSGSSISFSVKENNSGASRTGKITVTYGDVSKELTITQSYAAPSIILAPAFGSHDYVSGTYTFKYTVSNPREGQTVVVSSSEEWITGVFDSDGTVSYKVSINTTGSSRSGNITMKYGEWTQEFALTQDAASLALSSYSATYDYKAVSKTFGVTIPNRQSNLEVSVRSNVAWITNVSEESGTVSFTVSENNSGPSRTGKITVTYAGVSKEFTITQGNAPGNLSASGAANCYIVSGTGSYYFSSVKGCSSTSVGAVESVAVLWESFGTSVTPSVGDLIKSVSYKDGKIHFDTATTFKEGNAVIAATNSSGAVIWSWHIWFTDQPEGQECYNNAGTMMDRNLGATSATPGDVGALGLLYQWGRKDPFLGSSSISSSTLAKSTITWPSAVSSNSSSGTIGYATSHPTTFISSGSDNSDWYYTGDSSTDNTRWTTSESTKSIYDPCPADWRVPDGGEDGVWSTAKGSSSSFRHDYNDTNEGINFSGTIGGAATIWYPASGSRHYNEGDLNYVGNRGYYWSASPSSNNGYYAYYLSFYHTGAVNLSVISQRASGYSVRCVKVID